MFVQLEPGVFVQEYETLEAMRSDLFEKHPGKYVAIYEATVLAVADLAAEAWRKGLGALGVAVEFVVEHITERREEFSIVPTLVGTP